MAKHLFKAGNPGGPGRPEGSKNKNFTNLSVWFELLHNELAGMDAKERLQYIVMAIDKLLPKVASLPASPGDSASNAAAAYNLMNNLAPESLPTPEAPHVNGNGNGASNGA